MGNDDGRGDENNCPGFPYQDSEAARRKHDASKAQRRKAKRARKPGSILSKFDRAKPIAKPPHLGGHVMIPMSIVGKKSG